MTEQIMDQLFDFFKEKGVDKVRLVDIFHEFIQPNGMNNEVIFLLGNDDRFKRVIGLISPTRAMTLATYDSIADIPDWYRDEHESFEVSELNIDVWYELNG